MCVRQVGQRGHGQVGEVELGDGAREESWDEGGERLHWLYLEKRQKEKKKDLAVKSSGWGGTMKLQRIRLILNDLGQRRWLNYGILARERGDGFFHRTLALVGPLEECGC